MIKELLASLLLALSPADGTHVATTMQGTSLHVQEVHQCLKDCVTSPAGIALIKEFEGYYPYPYICPAGKRTIGYGHVILPHERFDGPLMAEAAEALLKKDVHDHALHVNRMVQVELWPLQFDALSSFAFNLGPGALKSSTLLKRVNARAHGDVPDQLKRWIHVNRKPVKGLVRRRAAEAALYVRERP